MATAIAVQLVEEALEHICQELEHANARHSNFHSIQEGYCVIDESLIQLRKLMTDFKREDWNKDLMYRRLTKLAAMTLKLMSQFPNLK